jgi:hypothetical protein
MTVRWAPPRRAQAVSGQPHACEPDSDKEATGEDPGSSAPSRKKLLSQPRSRGTIPLRMKRWTWISRSCFVSKCLLCDGITPRSNFGHPRHLDLGSGVCGPRRSSGFSPGFPGTLCLAARRSHPSGSASPDDQPTPTLSGPSPWFTLRPPRFPPQEPWPHFQSNDWAMSDGQDRRRLRRPNTGIAVRSAQTVLHNLCG